MALVQPQEHNVLPTRENSVFKKIVKCYEHKQYKNGLKFAKQILASHPDHGETLSMKGLILNCVGKKDEAYDHVRRGLRNNLRSHVCWHVYGILQRSDKKYDEAIKCYRNALKWDKDNIQILRDLSHLQIQMRDLEGYRETRYQLFMLRPTQRVSWIGYAMAQHLVKDYDMALSILDTFRDTLSKESVDFEQSELLLYQNMVLRESGKHADAIEHLDKYMSQICDKLTVQEIKGELYLSVDDKASARTVYEQLLQRNPESRRYFAGLERCLGAADEQQRIDMYRRYSEQFPRAHAPRKLQLYINTERLRTIGGQMLRQGLQKGAPALFTDLSCVYDRCPDSIAVVEQMVLEYERCLSRYGRFSEHAEGELAVSSQTNHCDAASNCDNPVSPPSASPQQLQPPASPPSVQLEQLQLDTTSPPRQPSEERESPSCLLWTLFYLAQHFDYRGLTDRALDYVNRALEHTPTLIELFLFKGKLFKHAGNPMEAYRWLNEAQAMDTADRYINSKAAKYMLRANLISEAEELCSKFTREGVQAAEDLNNMQCMWYLTETALAYQRLERWGDALKKCHEIDRHFSDIVEDQFDFNTYCLRRMTIRSYVGLLRLEDILRRHPFYFKAARCAIEIYLHLHDRPTSHDDEQTKNTENLSPDELKKLRSQMRKARKRERQLQERKQQEEQKRQQNPKKEEAEDTKSEQLDPVKLAETERPLEEADRFLQPLLQLAADNMQTQLMAFEIYSRKGKTLLMLRALKRAHSLASVDGADGPSACPPLHCHLVRMWCHLERLRADMSAPVRQVVQQLATPLFGPHSSSAQLMNERWIDAHRHSLSHILQGAKMVYYLDKDKDQEATDLVTNLDKFSDCTWQTCLDVWKTLECGDLGAAGCAAAATFRDACAVRFPYCSLLGGTQPQSCSTEQLQSITDSAASDN